MIEFSRNVLKKSGANSKEIDPETEYPVIIDMPEHHPGQMGGTMRLGKRRTIFKDDNCTLSKYQTLGLENLLPIALQPDVGLHFLHYASPSNPILGLARPISITLIVLRSRVTQWLRG